MPNKIKLFTVQELSENQYFPWKERTIRTFIAQGKLKAMYSKNGQSVVASDEIVRFLRENLDNHVKKTEEIIKQFDQ